MPLRVKGAANAGGGAVSPAISLRARSALSGIDTACGSSRELPQRAGAQRGGTDIAFMLSWYAVHTTRFRVVEEEEREGGEEAGEERTAKSEGEGEERREEGRETERGDTRVRYTCPLTPGLKELGVITGTVPAIALRSPVLRYAPHSVKPSTDIEGSLSSYAKHGTEMAYAIASVSGTELAYAATRGRGTVQSSDW
eukprot:1868543-Rhodomonas_salina.1